MPTVNKHFVPCLQRAMSELSREDLELFAMCNFVVNGCRESFGRDALDIIASLPMDVDRGRQIMERIMARVDALIAEADKGADNHFSCS